MKRNKVKCEDCGCEISLSNVSKHKNSKICLKNKSNKKSIKVLDEWKQENGLYKCPYCGKEFSKKGIGNHIWSKHTDEGISFRREQCNTFFNTKGISAWNKGLTKETDERVRKRGETLSNNIKTGKTENKSIGRKHTEEVKKIISEKALASNHRRLCRSTRKYICKDGTEILLDSSWEEKLALLLDEKEYNWFRPIEPMFWIDAKGKKRRYYPDFYLIDYDIYLDPKNPCAYNQQIEKVNFILQNYKNVVILKSEEEIINFEIFLAVADRSSKPCI